MLDQGSASLDLFSSQDRQSTARRPHPADHRASRSLTPKICTRLTWPFRTASLSIRLSSTQGSCSSVCRLYATRRARADCRVHRQVRHDRAYTRSACCTRLSSQNHIRSDPDELDLERLWCDLRQEVSLVESGGEYRPGYSSFAHLCGGYDSSYYARLVASRIDALLTFTLRDTSIVSRSPSICSRRASRRCVRV